jgi:hypothetical protein
MNDVHEAYHPVIDDGRGIFPEDVRVKAPRGARQAIAEAAQLNNTTQSEWLRRAILRELEAVGFACGAAPLSGWRLKCRLSTKSKKAKRMPPTSAR